MTTEVRNAPIVVGQEAPPNAPEARNALVVVGADAPPNAPEVRNAILVVGYEPGGAGGGSTVVLMTGRRARRSPWVAV